MYTFAHLKPNELFHLMQIAVDIKHMFLLMVPIFQFEVPLRTSCQISTLCCCVSVLTATWAHFSQVISEEYLGPFPAPLTFSLPTELKVAGSLKYIYYKGQESFSHMMKGHHRKLGLKSKADLNTMPSRVDHID